MAVGFAVIEVLVCALHVHFAGVPVAIANGGLWSPMRPDAKLRVSEPIGNAIGGERVARALEWAGCDGQGLGERAAECEGWSSGGEQFEGLTARESHISEEVLFDNR